MRDIKFRGKRAGNGEWVYAGLYSISEFLNPFIMKQNSLEKLHGFDPQTVGQFTGLHDKNGKEIYEGDIVVKDGYIWFDDGKPNYRGTVEWIYSQWQVVAHCVNPDKRGISDGMNEGLNDEGFEVGENSDWIVIGNIYENPELLKVGECK